MKHIYVMAILLMMLGCDDGSNSGGADAMGDIDTNVEGQEGELCAEAVLTEGTADHYQAQKVRECVGELTCNFSYVEGVELTPSGRCDDPDTIGAECSSDSQCPDESVCLTGYLTPRCGNPQSGATYSPCARDVECMGVCAEDFLGNLQCM